MQPTPPKSESNESTPFDIKAPTLNLGEYGTFKLGDLTKPRRDRMDELDKRIDEAEQKAKLAGGAATVADRRVAEAGDDATDEDRERADAARDRADVADRELDDLSLVAMCEQIEIMCEGADGLAAKLQVSYEAGDLGTRAISAAQREVLKWLGVGEASGNV